MPALFSPLAYGVAPFSTPRRVVVPAPRKVLSILCAIDGTAGEKTLEDRYQHEARVDQRERVRYQIALRPHVQLRSVQPGGLHTSTRAPPALPNTCPGHR